MNSEIPKNIEKPEPEKKESVNLDTLHFEFCTDDSIRDFYSKQLQELEDKEKWLEDNQEKLEKEQEKIEKAVEEGLIADEQPQTIWQFQFDRANNRLEKVPQIKKELEAHLSEIKNEAAERLSKFLPNWSPNQTKIVFTINEKADFCINDETIVVDLGRLSSEQNPREKVAKGITHEVFHLWMPEDSEWSSSKQNEASEQALKERIIFNTIDEGLAVLIGGQSLEAFHAKKGRNFEEYKKRSFEFFNNFLSENDREELERIKNEGFKSMGYFYVVGNEIAKTVLEHDGIEKFREQIINARKNPSVLLQRYREISNQNPSLLKISNTSLDFLKQ